MKNQNIDNSRTYSSISNIQFHGQIINIDGDFAQIDTPVGHFTARIGGAVKQGDRAILFVRPETMKIETGP